MLVSRKVLPLVVCDMRLVQGGGVEDPPDPGHGAPHRGPVGDRAEMGDEGAREDVEAGDLMALLPEAADEGLAEMAGASCDQDFHGRRIVAQLEASVEPRADFSLSCGPSSYWGVAKR